MPQESAGILLWRRRGGLEVLLIHPGGPFWANKNAGAWMIPKGLIEAGETPATAALREFEEELGIRPAGSPVPLCRIRQAGGKWVEAFALEGELDIAEIRSNSFEIEWPPRSGRRQAFPEVDRAGWFGVGEARAMILPSQRPILDALERLSA
ncbi:NUDIX domain-containing protein [Sphingomonas sp. DT-204]|uniref:NUDIX domain-containing protein n=1 Tax=Sphingomonas sp. DT-204 TaxID=3396166 RepID=UPI003F1A7E9C